MKSGGGLSLPERRPAPACFLFLASVGLFFVPWGALGLLPLPLAQGVLLVLAWRQRSCLWPIHAALLVLTCVPLALLVWILTHWPNMD